VPSTLPCRSVVNDRMGLLVETAQAVATALRQVTDLGPSGRRNGQYALDVVADEAALAVLRKAGVGVLSEESGLERPDAQQVVIIDPVDGSTNASRGLPWYATSLCLVDADGPATALVVNQATGVRYWAERGGGAFCDGVPLTPTTCTDVRSAIVGLNGLPPAHLGYAQSRVFGAVALDLCQVAAGVLDGYIDCIVDAHGVWDFAGGTLICAEAGVAVVDLWDRDLFTMTHESRRTPVAAATPALLETLVAARRAMPTM
jgi:myo-inositol-1(or 4)-monophosphatase